MAEGPTLASLDAGNTTAADDMRAILAEAGGVDSSTPAETTTSVDTDTASDPLDSGEKTAAERARDDKGRFTKAQQEPQTGPQTLRQVKARRRRLPSRKTARSPQRPP